MALRIIHFADLHLDRSFASLAMTPLVAKRRREELRDALRRIITLAREQSAEVITVGGDLYEHEHFTPDTGNFLRETFANADPMRVFIAPGNHDPFMRDSLYQRIEWPDNVTIFGRPEFEAKILAPNVVLWGAGHNEHSLRRNLLREGKFQKPGANLVLLHGSDTSSVPQGKTAHCPFIPSDVIESGADFVLLGHYHRAYLWPEGNPKMGYPGSPEPLGFDEEGEHYVLRVDVDDIAVRASLVAVNSVSYRSFEIDVSDLSTVDAIREAIVNRADEANRERLIARVTLSGQLNPDVDLDREALLDACNEYFGYLDIVNKTYPAYDLDAIAEDATVRGAFVRSLRQGMESARGSEKAIMERAIILGLQALDKRQVRLP